MDAAAYMSLEDFKKELEILNDKVINFTPPPKTKQTRYNKQLPVKGNFMGNTYNGLNNFYRMSR